MNDQREKSTCLASFNLAERDFQTHPEGLIHANRADGGHRQDYLP